MKAIIVHAAGGPEVLSVEEVEVPKPGPGQVLVRNRFIGLNFLDVYQRSGTYPQPLPFTPGNEGAGVVEALGPRVKDFKVGDRVGYVGPIGAYSEALLRPAAQLIKLPKDLDDRVVASALLKGMTAEYLLRRLHAVKKGERILVHAAAGGVGQILCQWAKHLGAVVIGTVGRPEKVAIAKKAGCKHVIDTSAESFVERVKALGLVDVVYDSVGKDTFLGSLDCLRPRGLMVNYGNASGQAEAIKPGLLSQKGSLFLTRPTLNTYTATREELVASAKAVFAVLKSRAVKIAPPTVYAFAEVAQAHRDLEARKTTGSIVFAV